mmetsp:Transcript_5681/g.17341  ORF Transcript_5681/g.17341 Transcript_5681/m.17341 type:complete len:221 (+) Transcript_5681:113-775(+)
MERLFLFLPSLAQEQCMLSSFVIAPRRPPIQPNLLPAHLLHILSLPPQPALRASTPLALSYTRQAPPFPKPTNQPNKQTERPTNQTNGPTALACTRRCCTHSSCLRSCTSLRSASRVSRRWCHASWHITRQSLLRRAPITSCIRTPATRASCASTLSGRAGCRSCRLTTAPRPSAWRAKRRWQSRWGRCSGSRTHLRQTREPSCKPRLLMRRRLAKRTGW